MLQSPSDDYQGPRSGSDDYQGPGSGGSVQFTMWEESDLLPPPPLERRTPETREVFADDPFTAERKFRRSVTVPPPRSSASPRSEPVPFRGSKTPPRSITPNLSAPFGRNLFERACTEPVSPAAAEGGADDSGLPPASRISASALERGGEEGGGGAELTTEALVGRAPWGSSSRSTDYLPSKSSPDLAQQRRPVRSPLLWSEDELTAFIRCLGVSPAVCARVQQRKMKGVVHLLEMSNSELRRDFGLLSPVERIVVRQSLKRLLNADRWENNARGHKVCDVLEDSVLSHYIVPVEELTLVQRIAQGGYGTVYRGVLESSTPAPGNPNRHKSNLVAVKEMKGERRVRLYELLKEARVMASLSNENICTFIGICADSSARKYYILSELMDCSLFDLIHQPYKLRWHGELSISLVVSLSKGICAGIVYFHAKNLVHADLKSSNILIDYSSSWELIPRICDFGHAAVRAFPSPHHRCGTPHWAGPEVLRGEALGPAADVYSFGVIMWEMLTQKLPHKGLSFGQVLASVGWAGLGVDLSALPEVPADLRRLLRSCLSFTPAERPNGRDVQKRLRHIPKQARLKALKMLAIFMG